MVYPEGDMAEPQETDQSQEPGNKDPRLAEITNEIFRIFSVGWPDLKPTQASRALELLQELAQKQSDAQRRIEQLEAKNAVLQMQSDRDPYNPEVYSANGWYRIMRDKLAELKRNKRGAVILAVDIDDFKLYNDTTNSHTEGDIALGLAGQLMKDTLRPTDIVTRLHGDEFVIVALDAAITEGVIIAERLRQSVTQMPALLKTSVPLSVSIGVAELGTEVIQAEYDSDEQFIAALKQSYALADRAQYEGAKHVGKNRIGVMLADGTIQTAIINTSAKGQTPTITYQES